MYDMFTIFSPLRHKSSKATKSHPKSLFVYKTILAIVFSLTYYNLSIPFAKLMDEDESKKESR